MKLVAILIALGAFALSSAQTCEPVEPCLGTWDTTTCQCYLIVCDPGPIIPSGVNTWLGYPDCKWACVQKTCSINQRWNQKKCKCVCDRRASCSSVNGVKRYFDEGSCSCLCENALYSRCAYGFDHEKCSCRPQFCTQTALCIIGYEWDPYQCKCVPTVV